MELEAVPAEELIKSGELDGREALEYLSATGLYVFHGSPRDIDELEPRQARSNGQIDGEPAVAATTNIDQAIFRALIHSDRDKKLGRQHRSGWSGADDGMHYLALASSIEVLSDEDIGHVYAMTIKENQFVPVRGEMRSLHPVKPSFGVIVHKSDLPPIIDFVTAEELDEYQEKLRNA